MNFGVYSGGSFLSIVGEADLVSPKLAYQVCCGVPPSIQFLGLMQLLHLKLTSLLLA